MERHFYIGWGSKNAELVQRVEEKLAHCQEARARLASDFSAAAVWTRGRQVYGLIFPRRQQAAWLEIAFSGGYFFAYRGRTDTIKGRALARRIQKESMLHFDPAKYIINTLRLQRQITEPGHVFRSWAGSVNGTIFVSIPGSKKRSAGTDPFPAVPGWLHEVNESSWLKAQGLWR